MTSKILLVLLFAGPVLAYLTILNIWVASLAGASLSTSFMAVGLLLNGEYQAESFVHILVGTWILSLVLSLWMGLLIRSIFRSRYTAYEDQLLRGPFGRTRTRILGVISILIGLSTLGVLAWLWLIKDPQRFEMLGTLPGAASFLGLGAYYFFSGRKAATPEEYIVQGNLSDP